MSILRISDYTRPAAERWRGGVVFGGGRRRSRPAPTSFAPMGASNGGARAPSGDWLRAGEGFGKGADWGRWRGASSMLGARALGPGGGGEGGGTVGK